MANVNKLGDDQIKCLAIVNHSNVDITVYLYIGFAPFCKLSTISKIIKQFERYIYYERKPFKFKIVAKSLDDKKTETLLGPEELKEGKIITITKSRKCEQKNLADVENGRRFILRKMHREEEVKPADLYDILGLNMDEVRRMKMEDAKKTISKAFKKQIRIWHPDKNFGDGETAMQIIMAYEILMDDERRARFHNEVDYNKGWFSPKRWKAIFWPDCYTEKQNEEFWIRIGMFAISLLYAVSGIALTVATAGAAVPIMIVGGIFGAGYAGAGFQSLGYTVSKESVLDGCDFDSWCIKLMGGYFGGILTGGVGVGITAGIIGIGSAAIGSSAVTAAQYVEMGAANGAVGGAALSISLDVATLVFGEEEFTIGQVLSRAAAGMVIGGCAGALGGLVTNSFVTDNRASAATSTLEGETAEQVSVQTGGESIRHVVEHQVSKQAAITGTKTVLMTPKNIVKERLDDSAENKKIGQHLKDGVVDTVVSVASNCAVTSAGAAAGQAMKNYKESRSRNVESGKRANAESYVNTNEASENIQGPGNEANEDQDAGDENREQSKEANKEDEDDELHKKMGYGSFCFTPEKEINTQNETDEANEDKDAGDKNREQSKEENKMRSFCFTPEKENNTQNETDESGNQSNNANTGKSPEQDEQNDCGSNDKGYCKSTQENPHADVFNVNSRKNQQSGGQSNKENQQQSDGVSDEKHERTIKYRSNGLWLSKMIVTYYLRDEKIPKEVSGDGTRVHIPWDATDIEVKFQVQRPIWGDVMKHDRFKESWYEPYTPHIFRYKKAVDRTFTIGGPLWGEKVTRVSNEYSEETNEMS